MRCENVTRNQPAEHDDSLPPCLNVTRFAEFCEATSRFDGTICLLLRLHADIGAADCPINAVAKT